MLEVDKIMTLKEWGDFLGTRALGERVRERILTTLRSSSGRLVLDFEGVAGMTQSFADETFRKLLLEITSSERARILTRSMTPDVRAVLRYATTQNRNHP